MNLRPFSHASSYSPARRARRRAKARRGRLPRPWAESLEGRQLLASFAQSSNVAFIGGSQVINGGYLPDTLPGYTFSNLAPGSVNSASLAAYDTVVLNVASSAMGCDVNTLSAAAKADLVDFVGAGGKLIIYDSECPPQDYSWLPYQFATSNPGAAGANGTLVISEENTLSSSDPTSPQYVDVGYLSTGTDAVGDANVFTSFDSHWCADMVATNTQGVTGPVHTYATYGTAGTQTQGLIIYNGLDVDYMGYESSANGLAKIWQLELEQSFNPAVGLPCATPVTGITLEPAAAEDQVGRPHTVTATLEDLLGNPQLGVPVTFTIVSGPNAGATGTLSPADGRTDAQGQVTFTYVGANLGTDTIEASYVNAGGQTITSQPVTMTWVIQHSPPNSADDLYYTHEDTMLVIPAAGVLTNDSDTDPEHVLSAQLVTDVQHGTLTLKADGSFAYMPAAGFVGQDTFQYQASDGYDVGNVATVTLVVFPPVTVGLSAASDSGESSSDGITNVNRPTFLGTAEVGSQVEVFALPQGAMTPISLGTATPDAQGNWTLTPATAMADGTYAITAEETHPSQPDREAEVADMATPLVLDTVGPRATALWFNPATGTLTVTLQDDRGGLDQASIANPGAYHLVRLHTPPRYRLMAASATASDSVVAPTSLQTVAVRFVDGRGSSRLGAGHYVAGAISSLILDRAGNPLDGEFHGQFPSGDGTPGGDLSAYFTVRPNAGTTTIGPVTPQIGSLAGRHRMTPIPTSARLRAVVSAAHRFVASHAPRPDVRALLLRRSARSHA